jgi:hypothetical protein
VVRALGAFPSRSKVQILLGANNFLGQPASKVGVLPDLCGGGALHTSEVYPTWVGIQSGPALEGFLVKIKNKNLKLVPISALIMMCSSLFHKRCKVCPCAGTGNMFSI